MKSTRTKLAVLALTAITTIGLAGCSAPGQTTGDTSTGPLKPISGSLKGKTLTVWGAASNGAQYTALYKNFEAATGAKVNVVNFPDPYETSVETKIAAGDRPDVMIFQQVPAFLSKINPEKNLVDLTDQPFVKAQKYGQPAADAFNGKDYGVSLDYPDVFGMYYNKAQLAKLNTGAPTTYDAVMKGCSAAKSHGTSFLNIANGDAWPDQYLMYALWSNINNHTDAEQLNTNKAQYTSPAFAQAWTQMASLQKSGCYQPNASSGTWAQQGQAIMAGTSVATPNQLSMLPALISQYGAQKVSDTIAYAPFGTDAAHPQVQWVPSFGYFVPKTNTTQERLAISFLTYATSKVGYTKYLNVSGQPSNLSTVASPSSTAPIYKAIDQEFAKYSSPNFQVYLKFGIGAGFTSATQDLNNGKISPATAASRTQAEFSQGMTALGAPGF